MPKRALAGDARSGPGGRGAPLPEQVDSFSRLAARFAGRPDTGLPVPGGPRGRFGADALKVRGRILALMSRGQLVVKLPEVRRRELIDQGLGESFTTGRGFPAPAWAAVPTHGPGLWRTLSEEAFTHVPSPGAG